MGAEPPLTACPAPPSPVYKDCVFVTARRAEVVGKNHFNILETYCFFRFFGGFFMAFGQKTMVINHGY